MITTNGNTIQSEPHPLKNKQFLNNPQEINVVLAYKDKKESRTRRTSPHKMLTNKTGTIKCLMQLVLWIWKTKKSKFWL